MAARLAQCRNAALLASRSRRLGTLVGGLAAAAVYDDVSGGRLWLPDRLLPKRSTYNVIAEAGDPDAERTVVFISHHDAAHSGLVFHPGLPRLAMKLMPRLRENAEQSVPIIFGVFLGPGVRRPLGAGPAGASFGAWGRVLLTKRSRGLR